MKERETQMTKHTQGEGRVRMKISATGKTSNTFSGVDLLVIDPCYVISWTIGLGEEWGEVVQAIDRAGTIIIDGAEVLYTQTKYGDGYYPVRARGQETKRLSVDSGLLSVWRVKDALKINPDLNLTFGVVVPTVTGQVYVDGYERMIGGAVLCRTGEEW